MRAAGRAPAAAARYQSREDRLRYQISTTITQGKQLLVLLQAL
jgi:hypothetical protein